MFLFVNFSFSFSFSFRLSILECLSVLSSLYDLRNSQIFQDVIYLAESNFLIGPWMTHLQCSILESRQEEHLNYCFVSRSIYRIG